MTGSENTGTTGGEGASEGRGYSLTGRIISGFVMGCLLLVGVGGWAATANLAGAVIVSGVVAVDQKLKSVQHRDGGIVAAIDVREGDFVEAGQVLIHLEDAATRAEYSILKSQIAELSARRTHLIADMIGADELVFSQDLLNAGEEVQALLSVERALFHSHIRDRESKKQQLGLSINQIEEEIIGLEVQRDAKAGEIELVNEEQERITSLVERGLVERPRMYSINREVSRLLGERGEIDASIARARAKISEIRLQVLSVDDMHRTQAQDELTKVETRLAELRERRMATEDLLARTEIRAPISGVVNELSMYTIGGVITPAEVVATIVPADAKLTIEAQIPPISIDQVRQGQDARLRFSAFNQPTTPEIPGKVTQVSAATTQAQGSGESFYVAVITVDDAAQKEMSGLKLIPGMPVEVFVTTDYRTPLEYLAKPVTDQFERAFRER